MSENLLGTHDAEIEDAEQHRQHGKHPDRVDSRTSRD
jgi:hypothetical protein